MGKYKTYELIISSLEMDEEQGLNALSLVDKPAFKFEVLKFNEDNSQEFVFSSEEERIILGVALLADTPIFRKPNKVVKEPHYIYFSKDTIKNIVIDYFKAKLNDSVTINHKLFVEGVTLYQSIIVDKNKGINAPEAFKSVNDGSWIVALKVDNEDVWDDFKSGKIKGISIEGKFMYTDSINDEEDIDETEQLLSEIYKLIKQK